MTVELWLYKMTQRGSGHCGNEALMPAGRFRRTIPQDDSAEASEHYRGAGSVIRYSIFSSSLSTVGKQETCHWQIQNAALPTDLAVSANKWVGTAMFLPQVLYTNVLLLTCPPLSSWSLQYALQRVILHGC